VLDLQTAGAPGRVVDENSQLEMQRRRYEAEMQKRAKVLLATQTRLRQSEQECDRIKFGLQGWATDKKTLEVLERKLDDAVQVQRDMVTKHAAELMRNQTTTKEAMGLLVEAQMQRDRSRRQCDEMTARLTDARNAEKSNRSKLHGEMASEHVELETRLRDTEVQRDLYRKQADDFKRAAMAGEQAKLQVVRCGCMHVDE
jgi:hypothetical protein